MSAPPVGYFSNLAQQSSNLILKFLALASTFFLAISCGGDKGESGKSSGGTKKPAPTYAYICPNGTPAAGTTFAPNTIKCNSCGTNYVEENDECFLDSDNDGVANRVDVDDDNDGLIEIHNATEMDYIQYNLAGTGLDDEADDSGANGGDTTGKDSNVTATSTGPACGANTSQITPVGRTCTISSSNKCLPTTMTARLTVQLDSIGGGQFRNTISVTYNGISKTFTLTGATNLLTSNRLRIENDAITMQGVAQSGGSSTILNHNPVSRPLSEFGVTVPLCGYELSNNIDLPNSWTPIGTSTNRFSGIFEGNYKAVGNLSGTAGAERRIFSDISSDATVRNINLVGTGITNGNKDDIAVDNINGGTVTGIVVAP